MSQHFNRLTPAQDERLALLAEECAEVIQAITKIQRHGYENHHPDGGPTNREVLHKEIGHVIARTLLMTNACDIEAKKLWHYRDAKMMQQPNYLRHQPKHLIRLHP